jgi:molecular chaperone GrpE
MSKRPTLAQLEQQIGELTEALQRERADAANIRRRAEEDRLQLGNFYKAMVIRDVLPIIDNCERLLQHISTNTEDGPLCSGVEQIVKQSHKILKDAGVERIKTVGQPFDPRFHEAISMEDVGGKKEIVSQELQAGYKLGDEIIRHSMVRVKRG